MRAEGETVKIPAFVAHDDRPFTAAARRPVGEEGMLGGFGPFGKVSYPFLEVQ